MSETVDGEMSDAVGDNAAEKDGPRWVSVMEVIEVIVLAVVALATAWSGFQAGKWNARQTELYGKANAQRFQASAASVYAAQAQGADAAILTAWLQAHGENNLQLQSLYAARFTPDYKVAFDAWLATDPFTNPQAPPGPSDMPQYHNTFLAQANRLNAEAAKTFDTGTAARDTGDKYVRYTVLLASVLFLVALAQRLTLRWTRVGLDVVAFGILVYSITNVLTLPHLQSVFS
jgi:hypothetical protein